MARRSAKTRRIYEAGLQAYPHGRTVGEERLLQAVALMLTEATKPASKAKKKKDEPVLPFGPKELYEACLERVPHVIGCEPYDRRWFGRMGKALQATSGLEREDLERFLGWVESGGLSFFSDCTFEHVIKHWGTWIVKARGNLGTGSAADSAGPEGFMK